MLFIFKKSLLYAVFRKVIMCNNDRYFFSYTVRHVANRSFWMYGYEGSEDVPVDVEYSEERNDLTFYAQLVQENYYLEEYDASVNLYFLGGDKYAKLS